MPDQPANTKQRRFATLNTFNHHMDRKAREANPDLAEIDRYNAAMAELRLLGVDVTENDLIHALNDAYNAHITRTIRPARDGTLLDQEGVIRANKVVERILDFFVGKKPENS